MLERNLSYGEVADLELHWKNYFLIFPCGNRSSAGTTNNFTDFTSTLAILPTMNLPPTAKSCILSGRNKRATNLQKNMKQLNSTCGVFGFTLFFKKKCLWNFFLSSLRHQNKVKESRLFTRLCCEVKNIPLLIHWLTFREMEE